MAGTGSSPLQPVTLTGNRVQLIPLAEAHHDALVSAVMDGELWKLWFTPIPSPERMRDEILRRIGLQAAGSMLPFSVLDRQTDTIVGMTSYRDIDLQNRRVEIGSTWYARSVQRTGLNTEAKLLLLGYAFDTMHCVAVEIRTDFMNQRSRQAIERLGAKLDGILRNHRVLADGLLSDTCVYSILITEWPTVEKHLRRPLAAARPS